MAKPSSTSALSSQLKTLVHGAVTVLGHIIAREAGDKIFDHIEGLRVEMTKIRETDDAGDLRILQRAFDQLSKLSRQDRLQVAHAFTLMLELMNACENAYRDYRAQRPSEQKPASKDKKPPVKPDSITYVLTAHPTEARSPQNIEIFQQVQSILFGLLQSGAPPVKDLALRHALDIAWRTSIVRLRQPKVKDEAEHILSSVLRPEILKTLLEFSEDGAPFQVRSWVGGDKDGHPGVNEKTLIESLQLSRDHLRRICHQHLNEVQATLQLFPSVKLKQRLRQAEKNLTKLKALKTNDALSVVRFHTSIKLLVQDYEKAIGTCHPALHVTLQILTMFPGLVVPLELREASDMLMEKPKGRAIDRMLKAVERLSRGGHSRWYARGLIISMTESAAHLRAAASAQQAVFGEVPLPVIPLFENAAALDGASQIVTEILADAKFKKSLLQNWNKTFEMMVGYSDSSKESGVLWSRLKISEALPRLEKLCLKAGVTPVFFHGSGGSVDRGGGSIEDQTAWWPESALRRFKVTVQGEMVERSMASAPIARRTLDSILENMTRGLSRYQGPGPSTLRSNPALDAFADQVAEKYRARVRDPQFLHWVELATPYSYLNLLKIGSRPTKRTGTLSVPSLRAIPWVLCWTQTRVLFPTWWGTGSAWAELKPKQKDDLREALKSHSVFRSYMKALGFTLAKIEMPVWKLTLQKNLPASEAAAAYKLFQQEHQLALTFYRELTGEDELLWFRPWLGESIRLRSPMIHPLNLLQILAAQTKDANLLRVTVTGISSGMLTTG